MQHDQASFLIKEPFCISCSVISVHSLGPFFCWIVGLYTYQFLDTLYILGKLTLCLWRELQITSFCLHFLVVLWYVLPCRSCLHVVRFISFPLRLLDCKSFLLWSYEGILPSFLELLWLHFWHFNLESICNLSFILLQMAIQLSQYHLLNVPSFPSGLRCSLYHMLNSREILNRSLFRNSFLRFSTTLLSGVPLPHMPTQDLNFFLFKIPNSSSSELPVGGRSNGLCSLEADAAGLVWPSALIGSQAPGLLRDQQWRNSQSRKKISVVV